MDMELPTLKRLSDVTKAELRELQSVEFAKFVAMYTQAHGVRSQACLGFLDAYDSYGAALVRKELELCQPTRAGHNDRALGSLICKAATAPATVASGVWAGSLVGVEQLQFGFLAVAHSASVLGRMPGLRQVPFRVSVPLQTQEASFAWVSEGGAKPVSAMAFQQSTLLELTKAAGITVYTNEFLRNITNETAVGLRDSLRDTLVSFQDKALLSTAAAVAGVSPAGILAGITPVTSTGNLANDLQALLTAFYTARPAASEDTVLIAGPAKSAQLKTLNSGGGPGYAIITTDAAGTKIIVLDGRGMVFADGGLQLDISEGASLQMDSAPTTPSASTVFTSLWQDNKVGIRLERTVNWHAVASNVQFLA